MHLNDLLRLSGVRLDEAHQTGFDPRTNSAIKVASRKLRLSEEVIHDVVMCLVNAGSAGLRGGEWINEVMDLSGNITREEAMKLIFEVYTALSPALLKKTTEGNFVAFIPGLRGPETETKGGLFYVIADNGEEIECSTYGEAMEAKEEIESEGIGARITDEKPQKKASPDPKSFDGPLMAKVRSQQGPFTVGALKRLLLAQGVTHVAAESIIHDFLKRHSHEIVPYRQADNWVNSSYELAPDRSAAPMGDKQKRSDMFRNWMNTANTSGLDSE